MASQSGKKTTKGKQKQDLSWIPELREAANAISAKPLRNLTPEERLICGRYHAYKFANCTRSESSNRKAGAKAAAAFAKMGDSVIYGEMTLRDYADNATVYRDRMLGGAPFYDPFLIRAVLDNLGRVRR